jgi:hypothetical protein
MNDFVTRLESELHAAALRRERAGRIRGVALPRLRVGLAELPAAAVLTVLLGLAVAGVAILLASSPERTARPGVPAPLRGTWEHTPTELRVYPRGAGRCVNLGLGSSDPCYTIGSSATRVAHEWGTLSVAGDELTLNASGGPGPAVYRWRVAGGELRLTELRDPVATRSRALTGEPLTHVQKEHRDRSVPIGWTARVFASSRYGYSIRYPESWSARAAAANGRPDLLSSHPEGGALVSVAITAEDVPAGTSRGRWSSVVNSRPEAAGSVPGWWAYVNVDGARAMVVRYVTWDGTGQMWASFVHGGRGYTVVWRGEQSRGEGDARRFEALLKTILLER